MDNETKKQYLQKLQEEKNYTNILDLIEDESERKKIKAFTEDVYIQMVEGLMTLQKAAVEHPEKLAEVAKKRIPKE